MKIYRTKKQQKIILETYDKLLNEWGCPFLEKDIATSYGTTHIIEAGKDGAPPLVLFHGVGDDSALMWIYNAAFLAEHFKLYAVDTLGGPGKSVPNGNYNADFDDTLWIDEILNGLKLEQAFFAGVSHGAYRVQDYTLRRPEKVIKAISISGTVPAPPDENAGTNDSGGRSVHLKTMMKIFLPEALFPTDRNVSKLIKKLCGKNYTVFTQNKTIMEHYKALLLGFNNMAMKYHQIGTFTRQEADALREKVVYLVGEEDPFEKLGGKAALLGNRMNATFYKDAGHGLNHELSSEINKKILEIFQS